MVQEDYKGNQNELFDVKNSLEELIFQLNEFEEMGKDIVLDAIASNPKHPVYKNPALYTFYVKQNVNHRLRSVFRHYITLLRREDEYLNKLIYPLKGDKNDGKKN